ncbi:unnamed protein product, partial [Amoebophrya sp. A25]
IDADFASKKLDVVLAEAPSLSLLRATGAGAEVDRARVVSAFVEALTFASLSDSSDAALSEQIGVLQFLASILLKDSHFAALFFAREDFLEVLCNRGRAATRQCVSTKRRRGAGKRVANDAAMYASKRQRLDTNRQTENGTSSSGANGFGTSATGLALGSRTATGGPVEDESELFFWTRCVLRKASDNAR